MNGINSVTSKKEILLEDKKKRIKELLNMLIADSDTYDARFWPNTEISKASLEIIKNKAYPKGFDMFWFNKTAERIEKILEEMEVDELWQEIYPYVKKGCCEKAESWWEELNNWYRKMVCEALDSENITEIKNWLEHANHFYQSYCLFCKHAEIKPKEIPDFIRGAEDILRKIEDDEKRDKENLKDNKEEKYIGKYPDEPATQKQLNLIKRLIIEKNYLVDVNLENLTRREASELISKLLSR